MSFSQIHISGSQANPDYVYYNASVVNTTVQTTQLTDDPTITFQETRVSPIVRDASCYEISVQNFSLNGASKTLPVFIPIIASPSTNINTTIYSVSVGIKGASPKIATTSIVWEPENLTSYTQIPSLSAVQSSSDYYYCYTYTHWVNLVNKALRTSWTAAKASNTCGTQCPFIEFDETTGLFSMSQDANTSLVPYGSALPSPYNATSTSTAISGTYQSGEYSFVGWNSNMEGMISNLDSTYYGAGIKWVDGTGYELPETVINMGINALQVGGTKTVDNSVGTSLKSKPSVSTYVLTNPFLNNTTSQPIMVRMTETNISTGTLWSPVASIVIGTNSLPVRSEACSNPVLLGGSNASAQLGNAGSFQKVLIEVPINAVTADLYRGWILYQPLVPTYTSMDPIHDGITTVDFEVFWRNRFTNALVPMKLYNTGSVSLRLLFRRKGIFS